LEEISQSLKSGKLDKSDQLKEKLMQIENLEGELRSKKSEISKLKQQVNTLDSINIKIEENYKKLLSEKENQLQKSKNESEEKQQKIEELEQNMDEVIECQNSIQEKFNQAVADGEHWRAKDQANQAKMSQMNDAILTFKAKIARLKNGISDIFMSQIKPLKTEMASIGEKLAEFARFKNLFLTNFLNKFE
jgi:chromosome segregation ATPase